MPDSKMLQDAIIDAIALKEAASRAAETKILEKYSTEVRETLDNILEEAIDGGPFDDDEDVNIDDLDLDLEMPAEDPSLAPVGDVAEEVPLGAAEGEKLCPCPDTGETSKVTVSLSELTENNKRLEEEISQLEGEVSELDESEDITEDDETLEEGSEDKEEEVTVEAIQTALDGMDLKEIFDALSDEEEKEEDSENLEEEVDVDTKANLSGWAGRSNEEQEYEIEKELAGRVSSDWEEEVEGLKTAQEKLTFENKKLKEQLAKTTKIITQAQKHLQEQEKNINILEENLKSINVSNAKLLYTNRVLRNDSLNERQKNKIAENISKAQTVFEAKTIYETLNDVSPSSVRKKEKTLTEHIAPRSSFIRPRVEKKQQEPKINRLQELAGIKPKR